MIINLYFCNGVQKESVTYRLVNNPVSKRWIKKIKHLSRVPHSFLETTGLSFAQNIENIHHEFCNFAGVVYHKTNYSEQQSLNLLHELYVTNHDRLSKLKNNKILYEFHNAIHELEKQIGRRFYIGWGTNEGPLEEQFDCNEYYNETLVKNNLYLPWTELGKTPLHCFQNNEPINFQKFCNLAKPHVTLRAKFMIALQDLDPPALSQEFQQWFLQFRTPWLKHYNIRDWRARDEHTGVLLAEPADANMDIEKLLEEFPNFHSVELV